MLMKKVLEAPAVSIRLGSHTGDYGAAEPEARIGNPAKIQEFGINDARSR
jgi:hypothetical protein